MLAWLASHSTPASVELWHAKGQVKDNLLRLKPSSWLANPCSHSNIRTITSIWAVISGQTPRPIYTNSHNRTKQVKIIAEPRLAKWQKLEAIQRFIRPTLDYALRTMLPSKKWANDLDNHKRQVIKKALRLPKYTCNPALYCS